MKNIRMVEDVDLMNEKMIEAIPTLGNFFTVTPSLADWKRGPEYWKFFTSKLLDSSSLTMKICESGLMLPYYYSEDFVNKFSKSYDKGVKIEMIVNSREIPSTPFLNLIKDKKIDFYFSQHPLENFLVIDSSHFRIDKRGFKGDLKRTTLSLYYELRSQYLEEHFNKVQSEFSKKVLI